MKNNKQCPYPFPLPTFQRENDFKKLLSDYRTSIHGREFIMLGARTVKKVILPFKGVFWNFPFVFSLNGEKSAERSRDPNSKLSSALKRTIEAVSPLLSLLSVLSKGAFFSICLFFDVKGLAEKDGRNKEQMLKGLSISSSRKKKNPK